MSKQVVLERRFAHSPARVFEAWTEIEVLCRWFGCGVDMLWNVHEWDVRVGGGLRVSLDYDGTPFVIEGEFLVVEPPHHLQYRWGQETVDVAIMAEGEGCLVTLRHDDIATHELGGFLTGGWTSSLSQLQDILSSHPVKEER
jgi:uncharacterized protein YndB with AHSA1/START domain